VILLDTHALFWLLVKPDRLSSAAARAIRKALQRDGMAIASVSLWELASLAAAGRIGFEGRPEGFLNRIVQRDDVTVHGITPEIALLAARFPASFSGDPVDRIIGGTALAHGLTLVTKDARMQDSPLLKTVW
jgi:PIN domain nuclease of toxin-antitoxin system